MMIRISIFRCISNTYVMIYNDTFALLTPTSRDFYTHNYVAYYCCNISVVMAEINEGISAIITSMHSYIQNINL